MLGTFLVVFFAALMGSALGTAAIVFFAKVSDAAELSARIIGSVADGAKDGLRKGIDQK